MTAIALEAPVREAKKAKRSIPDSLVKEEIDGIRFYYHNYKKVLNKQSTLEEIMGCSALQSIIISYIMKTLFINRVDKNYYIFSNEIGHHISHKNNLSYDIALYDKKILTPDKIKNKYVQEIAPQLIIEVDTDISLDDTGMTSLSEYWMKKIQKVLQNGTQKLVWIFTKNQKIVVAEGEEWHIFNIDKDIQLIDNVTINVGNFLKEEGIEL